MVAKTRYKKRKKTAGTKKAVIFSILDQNPKISTDDVLKELKRRKVDMGGERSRQNFYSVKTLWKQERGRKMKRTGRKRGSKRGGNRGGRRPQATERPVSLDLEIQIQILQTENEKLKAAIAILLS